MAGYVKVWTDIFRDEWFTGLNIVERGVWLQMLVWAKMVGDTGQFAVRSWGSMGSQWGCERRTCGKCLRKFAEDSRINISEVGNILTVEIANYHEWQQATPKTVCKLVGNVRQNSHLSRAEQTKPDQSRAQKSAAENVDNLLQTFAQWETENTVALDQWRFEYDRMFGSGWVDSYVDDIPARIHEGLVIRDYLRYVKSMLRSASEEGKWGQKGLRSPMTAEQERAHYGEHDARTGQTHSNGEPESMADIISRVTDGTES